MELQAKQFTIHQQQYVETFIIHWVHTGLFINTCIVKMRNKSWNVFLLTFLVLIMLIGLFYLPRINVSGNDLRRVNIMSDIQTRNKEGKVIAEAIADSATCLVEEVIDSTAVIIKQSIVIDTVPPGMVAIEDFADSTGIIREMDHFYAALNEAGRRNVNIAYFGDSYIEGDILTMDLRAKLQEQYGGKGVGFIEIQCVTSGFRQTVATNRKGWRTYHSNERGKGFKADLQGLAGSYFIPSNDASFEATCQKSAYPALLDSADIATVYFTPGEGLNIHCTANGGNEMELYSNGIAQNAPTYEEVIEVMDSDSTVSHKTVTRTIMPVQKGSGNILARKMEKRMHRFNMSVTGGTSSRFYGVALDGKHGIALDNYSMRGSGGTHLMGIPQQTLQEFASLRPYDLIIIHFGLNVANEKQKNYGVYAQQLGNVIDHLKAAYPRASILVVSMGDRGKRGEDGEIHTMDGVRELIAYERKMASEHKVAFWNLYEAMGGDGSIAQMVSKKQANLDYTHINFKGGRHIAGLLYDVLMNGKKNYDNRKH